MFDNGSDAINSLLTESSFRDRADFHRRKKVNRGNEIARLKRKKEKKTGGMRNRVDLCLLGAGRKIGGNYRV